MKLMLNNDPSSTTTLRGIFASQYYKRFRKICGLIRKSVDTNDCFSLRSSNTKLLSLSSQPLSKKLYEFKSTPDKISLFMSWLKNVEQNELFEVIEGDSFLSGYSGVSYNIWQNKYIFTAYKKGIIWSRQQMKKDKDVFSKIKKEGMDLSIDEGSITDFLSGPVAVEEVRTLYLRAYNDLKGITEAMDAEITRVLADGLASGWNPTRIATDINNKVNKVGRYRANLLARTEVIRAHHLASIEQYRSFGITGTKVKAEWQTANDMKVCPLCAPLDYKKTGKLWGLDEIKTKIPVHPLCRCVALPHVTL